MQEKQLSNDTLLRYGNLDTDEVQKICQFINFDFLSLLCRLLLYNDGSQVNTFL
jgi:hypothetical protein